MARPSPRPGVRHRSGTARCVVGRAGTERSPPREPNCNLEPRAGRWRHGFR
jgi:hypothetical protein